MRGMSALSVGPTWPTTPSSTGTRRPIACGRISTCAMRASFGIELPIGEIRAEHQQRVAGFHRVIARGEADQAGHADVIGIVPLDMFLAAHGVDDRRLERFRQLHQLVMRARAAAAAQKRDALGLIDEFGELVERLVRWRDDGLALAQVRRASAPAPQRRPGAQHRRE